MRTDAEDPLTLRRDALRRIAYGTPDPSAAVIAELVEVEAELAARDAAADRAPRVPESGESPRGPSRESSPRRGPLPRWVLVGAVSVSLLIAAIVLEPVRSAMSPPRGLEVFEHVPPGHQRGAANKVAESAGLQPSSRSELRSLGRVFGYEFWVHRVDDVVCLLSRREFWFEWVDDCLGIDAFLASGLTRAISADELSDRARSSADIAPDEVVIVHWGADSLDIEWSIVRAGSPARPGDLDPDRGPPFRLDDAPTTYEEWSSSRIAE
ncbi:hypothetical protein [Agromyces humatus]|uniref:DUF1707 domain-containing protein n=1 Tax=Agromyces humatus TaxID=279573 RepID=A0ABP4X7J3_9MICO|nr:hypothetical protein [Agromyces humatus]